MTTKWRLKQDDCSLKISFKVTFWIQNEVQNEICWDSIRHGHEFKNCICNRNKRIFTNLGNITQVNIEQAVRIVFCNEAPGACPWNTAIHTEWEFISKLHAHTFIQFFCYGFHSCTTYAAHWHDNVAFLYCKMYRVRITPIARLHPDAHEWRC